MATTSIVVDALQVGREPSGVGRLVRGLGSQLHDLPEGIALELRCTKEASPLLAGSFPAAARVRTPLRRSRPRLLRILYQQVVAPLRDSTDTLLVCLGDQGPLWGRARVLLEINDIRRLALPATVGRLEGAFYRFIVPRAARRAAAVVTISEFSQHEIERLLNLRARVVPVHPPPRPEPSAGGDHLVVVGALRPYKDVETVVEALALLEPGERRVTRFAGPLEGRGEDIAQLAERRGVAPWIEVLGWVGEPALEQLYAGAFATVSPSTYEGYGLPVAESLAHGLATVASDIPAHREVAAEAALYFEPGDAESLAGCLRQLHADGGLRDELRRRAFDRSHDLSRSSPGWREIVLELATSTEVSRAG